MKVHWRNRLKGLDALKAMLWIIRVFVILGVYVQTVTSGRAVRRQAPPIFLNTPTNVTVHKGDLAVLPCHIRNLGTKMVVWRKEPEKHPLTIGEDPFTPSGEYSIDFAPITETEGKWNLLIKNVQVEHSGVYECQISSKKIFTRRVVLNVLKEPMELKPQLVITGTEYVNQFSEIRLVCNATGTMRAPDEVDWFFNGNKIHMSHPRWNGRVDILKHRELTERSYISELIVRYSTMDDQGNYVCRSSDLKVNSIKVHILNSDKNNPIVPRAPGEETDFNRVQNQMNIGNQQNAASKTYLELCLKLVIILAVSLAYR